MAGKHSGRVALVTGAASGIGRASAIQLAQDGARVACADLNGEGAESVAKEITRAGGEAIGLRLDVADPADNARAVDAVVKRFGKLTLAHLNAGIAAASNVLDTTLEEWSRTIAINLSGVFYGLQASARAIKNAGGGAIVITSSDAGLRGGGSMGSYCASKHGVLGLMKCAVADLSPHKIRVNAICPGVIDTPILGPLHKNKAFTEGVLAQAHPLGRVGQPEEIGRVVSFLLSDDASFVTGVGLSIDGGLNAVFGAFGGGQQGDNVLEKING
ncbi:MAG TPA: SDR family NAD(P)-dependent oxidoreductase [Myxococcota bacterium]|nr:SDR family NAD(P)-dependent oxidoreductase [Myxococcota bacterium]